MATTSAAAASQIAAQSGRALSLRSDASLDKASEEEKTATPLELDPSQDLNGHNAGVARIEALYIVFEKGWKIWMLYISIGLIAYAASLASNTLYVYLPFATSAFATHSKLGTITVVTSIVASVCKPGWSKLADMTSRPIAYLCSLVAYVLGLIIMASSSSVNAVAAGQVILTVGSTGLDITLTIVLGDITSLQWRGMAQGIVASPYIVNAFISGYITSGIGLEGWRWGYGMFAIILPAALAPALMVLFWADIKARKLGAVSIASPAYALHAGLKHEQSLARRFCDTLIFMDAFGLLLLGFAWSLILLPFTLSGTATGGWNNPSMIAMEVVGIVLLIVFTAYEFYWAPYPLMPKRVMNRTFICCILIDFFYYLSAYIQSTYYSSYVYVIKSWSTQNYTFFLNTLGVALCAFGLLAGAVQRITHGYKYPQLFGIAVRAIGMGLIMYGTGDNATDVVLVWAQILIGLGGAFSVIGSQVASQVCHSDMATAISLLSLWTGLGGSIGSAIASAVWTSLMPNNLAKRLQGLATPEEVTEIYGSLTAARSSAPEIRAAVIQAYDDTSKLHLYLPALITSIIPIAFGIWTVNFRLDEKQNAVEELKVVKMQDRVDDDEIARRAEEVRRKVLAEATAQGRD